MIYLFHTRLVQAWEKEGRNGPCRNDIAVQHYRHRHGATETEKVDETCKKAKWGEGWDDKVEVVATDVENRRRDGSDKRRTVEGGRGGMEYKQKWVAQEECGRTEGVEFSKRVVQQVQIRQGSKSWMFNE